MKFKTPNCPCCGSSPNRVLEEVQIQTYIIPEMDNGGFTWDPDTASDVDWDFSSPVKGPEGWTLYCENRHSWRSQIED